MANGVNKVFLLGNLGADPELRSTTSGQAVMRIRLATSKSWLDDKKQKQERVEWHTVIVWGNRATALARFLAKGMRLHIEGELRTREYEGSDGVKRYSTEVTAFEVTLCEKAPSNRAPAPDDDDAPEYGGRGDDDIPF
jgi:single-strand DNA-binding protein